MSQEEPKNPLGNTKPVTTDPSWEPSAIGHICHRKRCSKPTCYAYPAEGGGFAELCHDCGQKHLPNAWHITTLLSQGYKMSLPGAEDENTPSRYRWSYQGVTFDFYRLCEILGVRHHAQAHALKKIIRAGQSGKTLDQDIEEAIKAARRWLQMLVEDAKGGSGE